MWNCLKTSRSNVGSGVRWWMSSWCVATLIAGLSMLASAPASGQEVVWSLRTGNGPDVQSAAMAYDAARRVTVQFGGAGAPSNYTWEWDGNAWASHIGSGPAPRLGSAMAYDASRRVTVLFGGNFSGRVNGETWEWNGTAWTQRLVSGPPARYRHAMAYDTARGVTVLFGGGRNPGELADTWEWNGTAWTQRLVNGPSARYEHAMAYDAARGVTVLYGGYTTAAPHFNGETWEWNGSSWTQRPVSGPPVMNSHVMAYDASRAVTVMFGNNSQPETWEWDGIAWNRRTVQGPADRAYGDAMAYDAARGACVLLHHGETWELSGPCRAPFVTLQPISQTISPGSSVVLTVRTSDPFGTHQWRKSEANLTDDARISGAMTSTLTIDGIQPDDQGSYDCIVTSRCATLTSEAALVQVRCVGDFDGDGGIDGDDVTAFFAIWEVGQPSADVNDDGGIDGSDVETFFDRWEQGLC